MTELRHSEENTFKKPTIRLIHNLARSGGTLISKCIGCMNSVALLSEIHPSAQHAASFNAIKQAQQWLNFDPFYKKHHESTDFVAIIRAIEQHCADQQQTLVIRDWSHIDYLGVPVTSKPTNTPALINSLNKHFDILNVQLVRNPIDIWLSTRRLNLIKNTDITTKEFIQAYLHYLQKTRGSYQLIYENFLADPDKSLKQVCSALKLNFDQEYSQKWHTFAQLTGDLSNSSSLRAKATIKPRTPKSRNADEIREIQSLQSQPAYEKILELVPEFNCYTM